jgi:hypothetical protein
MRHSSILRVGVAYILGCIAAPVFTSTGAFAQLRPNLGTASAYPIFTGGGAKASVASETSQNGNSISNYPNPVSGRTTFSFILPVESIVNLTLADELGRAVSTLVNERFGAEGYNMPFNTAQLAA